MRLVKINNTWVCPDAIVFVHPLNGNERIGEYRTRVQFVHGELNWTYTPDQFIKAIQDGQMVDLDAPEEIPHDAGTYGGYLNPDR